MSFFTPEMTFNTFQDVSFKKMSLGQKSSLKYKKRTKRVI